ncbi:MAG: DNA-processing protein DprA [Acidimicrobiia bacterium]|nr:DNA-processing protein DprA [Acidimicrobiia bacterium]
MTADARLRLAAGALHPDRRRSLVARFGSPAAVLDAVLSGSVRVPDDARRAMGRDAAELRRFAAARSVDVVDREDPRYPERLRGVPDGPDVLFVRGTLPGAGPSVAVVGTRRSTAYGLDQARALGRSLSAAGVTVVSGLARGVDGAAHAGSLDGSTPGAAVLGCGPDVAYPSEHRPLADRLVRAGGAVLAEYPPGARPLPWRFPPRNRIIAALADAVVVVESPERGGALVTAAAGLDYGRTVMAVPGDVDRPTSRGCNLLVRDGALPVLGSDDLLETLEVSARPPERPEDRADPLEAAILAAAASRIELDDLAEVVGAEPSAVLSAVARLEVLGRLRRADGAVVGR